MTFAGKQEISQREAIVGRLFESGENADVGVIVSFTFGPRAVVMEKGLEESGGNSIRRWAIHDLPGYWPWRGITAVG